MSKLKLVQRLRLVQADVAERSTKVVVPGTLRVCREPKDDMVIETALEGAAEVLVTRDDDLKRAPEVMDVVTGRGVNVLSVRELLERLDETLLADT